MSEPANAVLEWLKYCRREYPLRVREVPFTQCHRWGMRDGRLGHETGGFFSVVGYRYLGGASHLHGFSQPFIDQPEIGLLGFVVKESAGGWQWLLQAKTEPGNVGGTQVGPTVQSTYSNYMRLHGGRATPMLELFLEPGALTRCHVDIEQSEQGDRFIGKYNRNVVVEVSESFRPDSTGRWRWFSARAVKEALLHNYAVNTDARSVLFCSDWSTLVDGGESAPFSHWQNQGGFGESLWNSWRYTDGLAEARQFQQSLQDARSALTHNFSVLGLDDLPGWRLDQSGVQPLEACRDPVVLFYAVDALSREVEHWCQPLLANRSIGRVVLLCACDDECLKFWLRSGCEPGLKEGLQWAPSFVTGVAHSDSEEVRTVMTSPSLQVRAQVMQSDEGGRFMHSVAQYQIVEVPKHLAHHLDRSADRGAWISLAGLKQLARHKGMLTNELRSVASLLLNWC